MVSVKRILFGTLAAGAFLALSGCPSPFLAAIKDTVARFPFSASTYTFVRQWGNANPQYSFLSAVVKVDSVGNFYVADYTFRVRKFDSSGNLKRTYDAAATAGLSGQLNDVAFDLSGNMYVATYSGTTGTVVKYDVNGNKLTWNPGTAINNPTAITVDYQGHVLVVDGGASTIVVLVFDASGNNVTSWNANGTGGATGNVFTTPTSITTDPSHNIYVCDSGSNKIWEYDSGGGLYSGYSITGVSSPKSIAYNSTSGKYYIADSGNNRIATTTSLATPPTTFTSAVTAPTSVAVDNGGNLYVADLPISSSPIFGSGVGRIQKFSSSGSLVASWGGSALTAYNELNTPAGIAFDSAGNVYVNDLGNKTVKKFNSNGGYIGQMSAITGYSGWLSSIVVDSKGTVYVPDIGNSQVQVLDSALNVGIPRTLQSLTYSPTPAAVALDSSDNLYVADINNATIQVLDPNGYATHVPPTIGTSGTTDGTLSFPAGVAVDSKGNVYVVNLPIFSTQPHIIQKFDKSGSFVKAWGTLGLGNGQFGFPIGIAIDKYDHVYVADFFGHQVVKFDSDGNYLGTIGSVGVGQGTFGWPLDVAIDSSGNLAVADGANDLVQILSPQP